MDDFEQMAAIGQIFHRSVVQYFNSLPKGRHAPVGVYLCTSASLDLMANKAINNLLRHFPFGQLTANGMSQAVEIRELPKS